MATIEQRIAALKRAGDEEAQLGYFEIPPVMGEAEWCESAAKQQAELCREDAKW